MYPWQQQSWQQLMARRASLPHALLLRGRSGIGKTVFARDFAQALLCEQGEQREPGAPACGVCQACNWFLQANHPDFRQIEPEALWSAEKLATENITTREPSKQLKIEQVRALQDFLGVGTHRGGLRIALIRPAEAMNTATANALLKSLEEPPANTLFLLVSSQPARLLPTIRSRCQVVDLSVPEPAQAIAWLKEQGIDHAEYALAYASYAPLDVLEQGEAAKLRSELLNRLVRGETDALALTDLCIGTAPTELVGWLQKWIYDLAASKLNEAPRYHPQAGDALRRLSAAMAWWPLLALQRRLNEARAVATHPLNARLFMEELFMLYRALGR